MSERRPPQRSDYAVFRDITTRWMDNDAYGHVNNVVYYSYFDTLVNAYLIERGLLDLGGDGPIGLVAETGCRFFRSLAFPEPVVGGLAVERLGTTSVRYGIGIFGGDEPAAAAAGHFVHVYVDRRSRRPVPLPARLRAALAALA